MRLDAGHAAAALVLPPGAPAGAVGPVVAVQPPAHAPRDGDGRTWVLIETEGGGTRGDAVALDGSEVIHGEIGLKNVQGAWRAIKRVKEEDLGKYKGQEAAGDARLLGLGFQEQPGRRGSGGTSVGKCRRRHFLTGVSQALVRPRGVCVFSIAGMEARTIITGGGLPAIP